MIKFLSVSKNFGNESFGLKNVSFDIDPGELILITGPSGSGKTTLMKLLTKEYEPTQGNIFFHDADIRDIKKSSIHKHRRKIGVVFQDYKLIEDLNVWENIALPLSIVGKSNHEIEERVTDLLTLVSLQDKAHLFPKQLSGGEAQRISIARALSTGPKVIFADEPTGNLDKETSLEIAKLIAKINSFGTTVLFATHDQDVMGIMSSNRHIKLDNGELTSDSNKPKKTSSDDKKNTSDSKAEKNKDLKTLKTNDIKSIEKKPGFWGSIFKKKSNKKIEDKAEKKEKPTEKKKSSKSKKAAAKDEKNKPSKKPYIDKKDTKEKE